MSINAVSNQTRSQKRPLNLWLMAAVYPLITFAYGTLNSLLILYLHRELGFSTTASYSLFAVFNALIFTLPIVAGFFSDYFGHREAIVIGILLCFIGLIVPSAKSIFFLHFGLAAFAVGLAVVANTVYCIVDLSYTKQDNQRESDFTLFYLLFNFGFLASILLAGFIADAIGYHATIALSSIAVALAFVLFLLFLPIMKPHPKRSFKGRLNFHPTINLIALFFAFSLTTALCTFLLSYLTLTNIIMFILIALSIVGITTFALKQKDNTSRLKLFAFLALCIFSVGFWALYMLEPSLLTIFIANNVNREIFSVVIPPSTFYALDATYIIILGLMLSYLWRFLAARNRDLSIPAKFTLSLFSMGIGYCVFAVGILFANPTSHLISVIWIFLGYIFLSTAELLLSPTGFSMVGRLSPKGREGILMGTWQLYTGFAAVISAFLADLAATPTSGMPVTTNPIYAKAFVVIGSIAIVAGCIAIFFVPLLKRLIGRKVPQPT